MLTKMLWRGIAAVAFILVCAQTQVLAQNAAPQGMTLLAPNQSIVGTLEESEPDDLMITAPDGTLYFVWPPENFAESRLESFYQKFRLKEVTLRGDVYRDADGYLSLFVKELPE